MAKYLSKTRFLSGSQCPKRLWLQIHKPDLAPPISASQKWTFEQGHQVGEIAKTFFEGGIDIDTSDFFGAARETKEWLSKDAPAIFEATFLADNLYARVDVLRRTLSGWDIIEVKSSTSVKSVHIQDVAFQKHLLERCGISVSGCYLMHIDNTFVHPDHGEILLLQNIDVQISEELPRVKSALPNILGHMTGAMPDVSIGGHCTTPYECEFKSHCWAHLPIDSVFTLPGIGVVKGLDLIERGFLGIHDAGLKQVLNSRQKEYVDLIASGEPAFNKETIRDGLRELTAPLFFFDFETTNPAVPWVDGLRPYQRTPFQYSCHIVDASGTVQHEEYLHSDRSDPRQPLISQMIRDLGSEGSIVVYNASFERSILQDLARQFPEYAKQLSGLIHRLWDLLPLVKSTIKHPEFRGSYSIKDVLPVLIPGLEYKGMTINNGSDVGPYWVRYSQMAPSDEREEIEKDILAYCHMDTLAMVRIWEFLKSLV